MFVLAWVLPKNIAWEENLDVGSSLEGGSQRQEWGNRECEWERRRGKKSQYKGVYYQGYGCELIPAGNTEKYTVSVDQEFGKSLAWQFWLGGLS